MSTVVQPEQIQQSWLQQLSSLIDDVEAGASELGWSARRVDIELSDAEVGKYQAPSLFLEQGACEIWVYPRYRDTPNDEGVVEVDLMPGMDDIVTLRFQHGDWKFRVRPQSCLNSDCPVRTGESLTRESIRKVLDAVTRHEV